MQRLILLLVASVLPLVLVAPVSAQTEPPLPWPAPASPPLPPDLSVPYLPAVEPVICGGGQLSCFQGLEADLRQRREALGCDHDAIFVDAYLTITRGLIDATTTPGFFDRPDRVNHEARSYAQEYFDQYDRWHSGNRGSVSPSWRIAFRAAHNEEVTAMGDLLLQLNAHIRRDNPIRAVEQTEGVLRVEDPMPAASGRPDHDQISEVLANSLEHMLDRLARRYDPTIDDGAELFGMVLDKEGLYSLISTWREESWRNAEQLRHARAAGGVDGRLYRAKLAQIEESARAGAEAIQAATLTRPAQNAERNAYCAVHVDNPA
jgi:Family of unknown function (DUF5995)